MTLTEIASKYTLSDDNVSVLNAAGYAEGDVDLFEVVTHFIKKGNVDAFKHFLENGYDVNSSEPGDFGSSLLHIAIRYGQMEIFDYLIANGADIDFIDKVGWTPLMECIIDAKPEFAQPLITKGADQSIANQRGATAKALSMKFGQHAIAQMLN